MSKNNVDEASDGGLPPRTGSASWIPGKTPDIPEGSSRNFWVTTRSKESGKLFVRPMIYMNAHVMPLSDDSYDVPDCGKPHKPEEEGYCEEYEWTGWFGGQCDHCECMWVYHENWSEIVAYAPAPEPFGQNA